ncbi:uncharacterized protein [Aegilops tauschii subsp. strangulata]|uniref:Transposase MuDR plant domain-containing protein n=4 Tax=Aegilops tauschii subsp. strangulata TaxID=200361 RepID=A0A453D4Y7_AEGTS|nr:uncharacterized protein LOC120974715 [Aegilops tauschii subsp. strangulata]
MDPLDYVCIRFHFRGQFEHDGTEWQYVNGSQGLSTVQHHKISLEELKNKLVEHVPCSDKQLQETNLHWKFPGMIRDGQMNSALVMLHDKKSVLEMAKHVTDAGVMDIYASIPDDFVAQEASDWEEEYAADIGEGNCDVDSGEEEMHHQVPEQEQQQVSEDNGQQERQEMHQMADNLEEQEHQPDWQWSNNFYQSASNLKLPVNRGPIQNHDRGKSVQNEDSGIDSSTSDSDYVVPPAESNSSASDDEVLELRKYAKELKQKVKKKMLREDEGKSCKVPDDFVVPETGRLDDSDGEGTPHFDSDDDLSYDEGSDGEVTEVRRRKTTHRVFGGTSEKPEFAVGMAFTDSRKFKQALVKYGLVNFHHLRFPKDEKKRVSAQCSWPGCPWSIYGSISSKSDWLQQ